MTDSIDEQMHGVGEPADFDAWARETPDTPADEFAAFVNALGPEGHYSDLEPEGVARIQDADGNFHELRRETLRALLRERDELATALRVEKQRCESAERLLAEALREQQVTADLRAARDMFRRPDQAGSVVHFSPGYTGEKPDHHGPADTCPMPACVKSRKQHEAVADIQDLTYEILGDQTRAFPGMDWLIYSHEHGAWWRPFERGYTGELAEAGRYIQARAEQICLNANAHLTEHPNEVMIEWTDDPQAAAAAVRAATGQWVADRVAREHP